MSRLVASEGLPGSRFGWSERRARLAKVSLLRRTDTRRGGQAIEDGEGEDIITAHEETGSYGAAAPAVRDDPQDGQVGRAQVAGRGGTPRRAGEAPVRPRVAGSKCNRQQPLPPVSARLGSSAVRRWGSSLSACGGFSMSVDTHCLEPGNGPDARVAAPSQLRSEGPFPAFSTARCRAGGNVVGAYFR
jgi:hypothetical protein